MDYDTIFKSGFTGILIRGISVEGEMKIEGEGACSRGPDPLPVKTCMPGGNSKVPSLPGPPIWIYPFAFTIIFSMFEGLTSHNILPESKNPSPPHMDIVFFVITVLLFVICLANVGFVAKAGEHGRPDCRPCGREVVWDRGVGTGSFLVSRFVDRVVFAGSGFLCYMSEGRLAGC